MKPEVPFIKYGEIVGSAEDVLAEHHPDGTIPIPIEDIVDVGFMISLVPRYDLESRFNTIAFITQDLQEIQVDHYIYTHQPHRLRFSLAHELGHLVLHEKVYSRMSFKTAEEWKKAMGVLSDEEYNRLEWQADTFADVLLVPSTSLQQKFAEIEAALRQTGKPFTRQSQEFQDLTVRKLARVFGTPSGAIWRRLRDEGFI